jgi:molecular chaperone DnaK (HSP70)
MMFKHLELLLAESIDSPNIARLKSLYIPIKVESNDRGSVDVVSRDGKSRYSVEELFGMIFKYIKELARENANSVVTDTVITVCYSVVFY